MADLKQYESHELHSFICVDALVSVHRLDFRLLHRPITGEAHNFPELIYVEEGTFDITVDAVNYSLHAGQCMIYPPCAYHVGPRHDNAAVSIVSFYCASTPLVQLYNRVMDLNEAQRQLLFVAVALGRTSFQDASLGHNMARRKNADTIRLHKLKSYLELFLISLFEHISDTAAQNQKSYKLQQFDEVTAYLKANIHRNLTVDEMAESCSMSPSKLKLLFREECELPPIAYFTSLKIEKAKDLICSTALSYTQIAEMLGFKTLCYFSDRFKKNTGMSPSEYAKTL